MVGRDMTDRFPPDREPHPIGDVALAIENWTVFHPPSINSARSSTTSRCGYGAARSSGSPD